MYVGQLDYLNSNVEYNLMYVGNLENSCFIKLLSRSFEVCLELNIKAGISYHLKMAGSMSINVEDQTKYVHTLFLPFLSSHISQYPSRSANLG